MFESVTTLIAVLLSPLSMVDAPSAPTFIDVPPVINKPATQQTEVRIRVTPFQKAVREASKLAVADGTITRGEARRLNRAMRVPAFRAAAEEHALIQMVYSDRRVFDNAVPRKDDGKIDRARIDWDALLAFLKEFIPWLLALLKEDLASMTHGNSVSVASMSVTWRAVA